MRLISGFDTPCHGEIVLDSQNMQGVPPEKRPTALIFQNLALFPWMSVADNIAFGLRARKLNPQRIEQKVEKLLNQVDLTGMGSRRIDQISGGQKQRVAIARALAVEPKALLLDEPLSALDLKLKQRMRSELKSIQRRTGLTFIYITHDQGEALAMSDRLAVMQNGQIEQVGTPKEIYQHPQSAFVASFVGDINQIPVQVLTVSPPSKKVTIQLPSATYELRSDDIKSNARLAVLMVRPEKITLHYPNPDIPILENQIRLSGKVMDQMYEGSQSHALIKLDEEFFANSLWKTPVPTSFSIKTGAAVELSFSHKDGMVFNLQESVRG